MCKKTYNKNVKYIIFIFLPFYDLKIYVLNCKNNYYDNYNNV